MHLCLLLGEQSEPHTGLFNRDRDIYICRFVCLRLTMGNPQKSYDKTCGLNYVVQTHACSKTVLGVLKKVPLNSTFIRPVKTNL